MRTVYLASAIEGINLETLQAHYLKVAANQVDVDRLIKVIEKETTKPIDARGKTSHMHR